MTPTLALVRAGSAPWDSAAVSALFENRSPVYATTTVWASERGSVGWGRIRQTSEDDVPAAKSDPESLRATFHQWSVVRLIEATTIQAREFPPESVQAMLAELAQRDVDPDAAAAILPQLPSRTGTAATSHSGAATAEPVSALQEGATETGEVAEVQS